MYLSGWIFSEFFSIRMESGPGQSASNRFIKLIYEGHENLRGNFLSGFSHLIRSSLKYHIKSKEINLFLCIKWMKSKAIEYKLKNHSSNNMLRVDI